jgi:hypothetical protein
MVTKQSLILQLEDEIFKTLQERTDLGYPAIAALHGVSESYIKSVAKRRRVQREPGRKKRAS